VPVLERAEYKPYTYILKENLMKKRVLSMFMALVLCLTLLPAPVRAEETENNVAVQTNTANVAAVNPDCPVCSAENADLSASKGTEEYA